MLLDVTTDCDMPAGSIGVGTILDTRYLLNEGMSSGRGGRGFRGEHSLLKRAVAIKVLHPHMIRDD